MTIQDLIAQLDGNAPLLSVAFAVAPLAALVSLLRGRVADSAPRRPGDYLDSVLVYVAGIPGIVSAVLVGYALFFTRVNLLEVSVVVYFLPIASMVVTYWLIRRRTTFNRLPGFGRLSGLMLLIALSFIVVLLLYKLRVLVGFFGSFEALAVLGIALFLGFQYAARKLTR